MLLVSRLQPTGPMFLRAVASLAFGALLFASSASRADEMLPNGGTLKFNRLLIHENGGNLNEPSNQVEATWHYFNKAHCECARQKRDDFDEAEFAWEITPEGSTTPLAPDLAA